MLYQCDMLFPRNKCWHSEVVIVLVDYSVIDVFMWSLWGSVSRMTYGNSRYVGIASIVIGTEDTLKTYFGH